MAAKQVVPGVTMVSLTIVNVFLVEHGDELYLIDTGMAGNEDKILEAVRQLGRQPADIGHIVVTHLHGDHSGSLAALKEATGAPAYMHPLDAEMVERGEAARPAEPGPGLLNQIMGRLMALAGGTRSVAPAAIEHYLNDGDELWPGGLRVVSAPGHTIGQVALLLPAGEGHQGVLFAADAAANMMGGLGYAPIYEDVAQGKWTLRKLAGLDFDVACFGHGGPIVGGAQQKFWEKWG